MKESLKLLVEALNPGKLNRLQKKLELDIRQLKARPNTDPQELNRIMFALDAIRDISSNPDLVDGKVSGKNNKFLAMLRKEELALRVEILKADPDLQKIADGYLRLKSLIRLTSDPTLYDSRADINENANRSRISRPYRNHSEFAQDLRAMYGEFLEPGEEDKESYKEAREYLQESNKKYEAEQVVKAYASGGWRKALSVIADLGIGGIASMYGLAIFGLATWGGPITAGSIGLGLLTALIIGAYGEVIKALLLGADNILRRNPRMRNLFDLAKKDNKSKKLIDSIKKEMDKEEPDKATLKSLKKELEKRLKLLEKEQIKLKEDADMRYVMKANLTESLLEKQYLLREESKVNAAGNYTKPGMRKRLFKRIMAGTKGGDPGEWSARKAQLLAREYKKAGGGYKD